MKRLYPFLCSILVSIVFYGQDIEHSLNQNNLVIKDQKFEIYATRYDEQVHKTTNEVNINFDYVTGNFYCGVQLKDLQLITDEELPEGVERPDQPYFQIRGVMPADQIFYDQGTDQQYKIELNLTIRDQVVPVIFEVFVKNYQETYGGFRQFIGTADFDLREIENEDLQGYNPLIKLVFSFQAFKRRT